MTGFFANGVAVSGNYAYLAANEGLKIIDVSNSNNPYEKSSLPGFYAYGITVQGNLAYVAAWDQGLKIIDVSNSSNPYEKSSVPGFDSQGVTVQGNLAYAATVGGLQIINVGNTTNPVLVGSSTSDMQSFDLKIRDNLVYIVGTAGLKIIDLSKWQLSGTPMQSKCTYQFIISSESLLHGNTTRTFTIKTDNFPYVVGAIPNQSLYPKNSLSLAVRLTKVFADEDKEDTLFLSINSEPQQDWLSFVVKPIFIARRTNFYSSALGVAVQGNFAYVAAWNQGLKIIDVSNSGHPFEKSSVPGFSARSVTVQGNLAYVAASEGLKIIDVSNSSDPYEKSSVLGFSAWGITVQGNLAYVAAYYPDGLKIIDVSNSSDPYEKSSVPRFEAWSVTVQGNLAYVADYYNGLKIIDVSNSSHPVEKSSVLGFSARGVTLQGNLAYVAASEGLKIIDVSRPNNPIVVGEFSGTSLYADAALPANKLCVVGNVFGILDLTNYQFSGTPQDSDVGNYNIKVTATDSFGAETYTNFIIRVEGGPILNHQIPPQILLVGEAANFFVTQGTFSDPNKDVITYEAMLAHNQILPSFLRFNPSSATFSGIPRAEDKEKSPYMITIFASDRIVYPATPANFTLVVQDPIADQTFVVDRTDSKLLPIPQDSTFEDRALVYGITLRNGSSLPHWLHFDAPNRKLSGTPTANDVGTTSMQVTLKDDYGEAFVLFNLKVKFNTPPILATMIPDQPIAAGDNFRFVFRDDTFTDADGDKLRYNVDLGKAVNWLKFDADNRTFTGTPSGWTDAYPYFTRTYTITINATDPSNATATGMFNLNLSGSYWAKYLTAGMVVLGTLATSYGYTHKKHLLWDFFKKGNYVMSNKLIALGDTEFSHRLRLPAQKIKSITVTLPQERSCAKGISPCFRKTLGFFPILGDAVNDVQTRVFPCGGVSAYLFPWLFYDSEENVLKSIKGGPTEEFIGKDIKIQVRGTDNRIMEEFQIKIVSEQNEIGEIADEADRARRKTRVRPRMVSMTEYKVTELKAPLISPIADIS